MGALPHVPSRPGHLCRQLGTVARLIAASRTLIANIKPGVVFGGNVTMQPMELALEVTVTYTVNTFYQSLRHQFICQILSVV